MSLNGIEFMYALFFIIKGDWEPAIDFFQKSIKHSEEIKNSLFSGMSWSGLGYAYSQLGDPETGRMHVEKGLKILHNSGIELVLSLPHLYLGRIHLSLGNISKAQSFTKEALGLSQKNNEKLIEGMSWVSLGRISGKTLPPQIDRARECILKGMEISHELKLKPYYSIGHLFLGELYLNAGEKDEAVKNIKKAEEAFQEMDMDYWLTRARGILNKL